MAVQPVCQKFARAIDAAIYTGKQSGGVINDTMPK
jgi:hypothetical protein